MLKKFRLGPILASVLALACTREAVGDVSVGDYAAIFNDHVEITVTGYESGTNPLTDFPLLVRISAVSPSGFSYARVDSAGNDIRFVYVDGTTSNAVPHEVDTWNTSGVSTIWVKLPSINNSWTSRKLVMFWAPTDASLIPANDPTAVWSGHTTVWHLNGTSDSTANAVSATKGENASARTGIIGSALGTRLVAKNGPILSVSTGSVIDSITNDSYTISGWVRLNSLAGGVPWLYSTRLTETNSAYGASLAAAADKQSATLDVWSDGTTCDNFPKANFELYEWAHFAVVHEGANGKHRVYFNGAEANERTTERTDVNGLAGFTLGGFTGEDASGTLCGDLDEVRIYPGRRDKSWFRNEYAQVTNENFVAFSNFYSTGYPVYQDEKTPGDDPSPGKAGDVSVDDYAGTAVFVPEGMTAGVTLTNFVTVVKVWDGEPPGFYHRDLPFVTEDLRFFDEQGNVLDYEIDLWDINNESFFWILLPELKSTTRIIMCWGLKEGKTLPPIDPLAVWDESFAGIWHMGEELDSTENDAPTAFGPNAVLNKYGKVGRTTGSLAAGANGAVLDIEASEAVEDVTNGTFTVSGWVMLNAKSQSHGWIFSRGSDDDPGWGARFCGGTSGDATQIAIETGTSSVTTDVSITVGDWTHLEFVYSAQKIVFYMNGEERFSSAAPRTFLSGTTGKFAIGSDTAGKHSVNAYFDEFRIRTGELTASERAVEYYVQDDEFFYDRQSVSWDDTAILQNRWKTLPTASKTEWNEGDDPATYTLGEPWYGSSSVSYVNRTTGESTNEMPTVAGDYRFVFYCPQNGRYSSLTYTIDFRIRMYRPTHDLGILNDRILLLNDDETVSDGKVTMQAYNDTAPVLGSPYWEHDVDSGYDYTSASQWYNFCGGMRHTYWTEDDSTRLWDLIDVRYGNTYNNSDEVFDLTGDWEEWEDGLSPVMNYLPWNPEGGCLVDDMGLSAEGWHEYAAQAVLCNTLKASINSTLYTNGIGTIYFDCVNSHTEDATNGYYKLVVQIATNALNRATNEPYGIPTDENIAATYTAWSEAEGRYVSVVHDPYKFADWQTVTMNVRLVNGSAMTDLGTTDELTMDLAGGGSYTNFYRVYVPVNILGTARFRIIRTAINPDYTVATDVHSMILVDNVICSTPTDRVRIEPRGHYDATKVWRETVGYEGAFKPSYPSISDEAIYARVRATRLDGQKPEDGVVSSVLMHYRWRYLNQQATEWLTLDIDPRAFISVKPISWPRISGDLEYWYEANQAGKFYSYADYSGLDLGLPDYSEELTSVTNRAETYATDGRDWFTRVRDGQSTYGTVKLYVRKGESAPVESVEMFVARDQVWRGCLQTTNAIADGVQFRFEVRDCQNDLLDDFQYNTNLWYLVESSEKLPVSGTVVPGTTNDWGCVPCDGATGHIMFQLDEKTRALTVVHADWQDFNAWNDADGGYFVGTSTDDSAKKGTSAKRREYESFSTRWEEDCATNAYWSESFVPVSYSDYDFYKPFLTETSPNGFEVGEGQWVRGAYADAASGMALQMAGQGRGYVQMVSPFVSPRGLQSVKFNARIAQDVSPGDAAYYLGGYALNDYTFVTRAAFDTSGNSNFTGNASLSLMAFFKPNGGCYEARWEQLGGDIENGSGTILGPTPRSQRLVLYRWRYSGRTWTSTELYAATNTDTVASWTDSLSPRAIPATYSLTNNLMPFMIGAYSSGSKSTDSTLVVAAVRIGGKNVAAKNYAGGVEAGASLPYIGVSDPGWLYIVYKDTAADRLTKGTYGLLSANCQAEFVRPQYVSSLVSWKDKVADTRKLTTQVYPKTTSDAEGKAYFGVGTARDCVEDIVDDLWVENSGRIEHITDPAATNWSGFVAAVVTQAVDVYRADLGESSGWTKIGSKTLVGFGKPGVLQNFTFDFWSTDDSSVRIQPGGELTDVRTDVIVDDIQITQWRGDDWLGADENESAIAGPTNFVYTSGWITEGALQLSPRRTKDDYPSSLRVPLCDGLGTKRAPRGIGLGYLEFTYRNAQPNARLLIQIATNGVYETTLRAYTLDPGKGALAWTTITNFDFSTMTESQRAKGVLQCSPGLHGVAGTMRILVDPTLRDEVKEETDPDYFGSIEIESVRFRDEPPLDQGCWWGWNIRTFGDKEDSELRMYLPDNPLRSLSPLNDWNGRSLALNNSITANCDPAELAKSPNPYREHMPFLQTPTFTSNVVGEVSFKARKYALQKGSQCAEVTLYGTREKSIVGLQDKDWELLNVFLVSNTTFEAYSFKTDASDGYRAFRFAVTGVDGVTYPGPDPVCGADPVRVLLDDVLVSEAVRARLAFRNVGAFRHDIAKTTYVPNVPSTSEQPIVGEGWGIQAEVFAAMLGEEIDTTVKPRVKLHYYKGVSPWGYSNWKSQATSAWLTPASDTNGIYRSSTADSPGAVIPMADSAEIVQYMLEVVYTVVNSETGGRSLATNWLESVDWSAPSWYYPVDYNQTIGEGRSDRFAAFAIVDKIAPGWAWINEINVFGEFNSSFLNSDSRKQFVEVVKPVDYDLDGWTLRMLAAKDYSDAETCTFITNTVALFGRDVSMQKAGGASCNYMSFIVVGNPTSELTGEQYDGKWTFSTRDYAVFNDGGELGCYYPVAMQLVRPSGIIEHEVAILGTNAIGSAAVAIGWQYSSTNMVAKLLRNDSKSGFFAVPDDFRSKATSTGVFRDRGETELCWNNTMKMTPGDLNEGQTIDPDYPRPGGEMILVFASVDTSFGHIVQTVGTETNTTALQTISIVRGSEAGLNIKYSVDPWYELGTVKETEDKTARIPIIATNAVRQYTVNVAKGAEKNVTVVASAAVDSRLRKFGLDEHNRYTPAVLHWLETGKDAYGNKFYDTESCEIKLAKFLALSGSVVTNMTLTQMYWLDMDPTVGEMYFKAGMVRPPSTVVWKDPTYDPQHDPQSYTNLRLGVYMSISNGNGLATCRKTVWAPYVLRGLGNDEISWNYSTKTGNANSWTSETFKVTGFLNSGLVSTTNETAWIPLRYFVFYENSFDANFESEIDVADPFSSRSPANAEGWSRWVREENEGVKPPVYLGWNIDARLKPVTAEILAPTNRLDSTP